MKIPPFVVDKTNNFSVSLVENQNMEFQINGLQDFRCFGNDEN